MTEQETNSGTLKSPHVVPDTPDKTVIDKAMDLIASLNASDQTKKLLSDLKKAAKNNDELVETANALKSILDGRESNLKERENYLFKNEKEVADGAAHNIELTEKLNSMKTDLENRESTLIKRQAEFREKQEGAVSYINGVLKNLEAVGKGLGYV